MGRTQTRAAASSEDSDVTDIESPHSSRPQAKAKVKAKPKPKPKSTLRQKTCAKCAAKNFIRAFICKECGQSFYEEIRIPKSRKYVGPLQRPFEDKVKGVLPVVLPPLPLFIPVLNLGLCPSGLLPAPLPSAPIQVRLGTEFLSVGGTELQRNCAENLQKIRRICRLPEGRVCNVSTTAEDADVVAVGVGNFVQVWQNGVVRFMINKNEKITKVQIIETSGNFFVLLYSCVSSFTYFAFSETTLETVVSRNLVPVGASEISRNFTSWDARITDAGLGLLAVSAEEPTFARLIDLETRESEIFATPYMTPVVAVALDEKVALGQRDGHVSVFNRNNAHRPEFSFNAGSRHWFVGMAFADDQQIVLAQNTLFFQELGAASFRYPRLGHVNQQCWTVAADRKFYYAGFQDGSLVCQATDARNRGRAGVWKLFSLATENSVVTISGSGTAKENAARTNHPIPDTAVPVHAVSVAGGHLVCAAGGLLIQMHGS